MGCDGRRRAEVASLDKESENREGMGESEASELEEILPLELLARKREAAGKEEARAHLMCLTAQSYRTEWEVKRQRLLSQIAALPPGFAR